MRDVLIESCPFCRGTNLAVGYQLGAGRVYADLYAYHATGDCADVEHLLCRDCGSIVHSRVVRTEMFHPYGLARQRKVDDYIDQHGILLCNENKELPSLCGLGYTMEDVAGLIDLHRVFYCKAYKGRSTYLSARAYHLLSRCRAPRELPPDAKAIYDEMKKYDFVDKDDLKRTVAMEKKAFDRAFDFLLENLYATAFAGKRINANWYSYLYCTADRWKRETPGLHFSGDPKAALRQTAGRAMGEADFDAFCR